MRKKLNTSCNAFNLFTLIKKGWGLLFAMLSLASFAQKDINSLPPKFQNLSLHDGLSNLAIHAICQDDLGYIWIGTARGLNRFDGVSFKHYYYNDDNESLYSDYITAIHKAPDGNLFCLTSSGINIFDIEKEKFRQLKSANNGFIAFTNYDSVIYAARRNKGIFWFNKDQIELQQVKNIPPNMDIDYLTSIDGSGIWGKSSNNQFIINYNPKTLNYEKYYLPNADTLTFGGAMSYINNHLIISTNTTIAIFDVQKRRFEKLSENFSALTQIQDKTINFITEIEDSIIWIGTKANGLYVYNVAKQTFTNFVKANDPNALKSDHLTCAFKDFTDNIWVGTFDRGLEVAFNRRKNFNFDLALHDFIKDKFVTTICCGLTETYYIGTRSNGLHIYNSQTKEKRILNQANSFLGNNHIRSLFFSSANDLWVSTEKQLHILNVTTGQNKTIDLPRPNNGIVSFCESNNKIFAGSDKQGLLVFSLEGKLQEIIPDFGSNITQILQQFEGKLLIASHSVGCFEYDIKNRKIQKIDMSHLLPAANFSQILNMYIDTKKNLWMGSFKYGLYRLSENRKKIDVFNMKSGLPSNDITGIVEDDFGNIWVSTAYGLSMLDKNDKCTNYSYNEGLENIQFHQKAALKDKQGTLYFGGNFGLTFFNPQFLELDKTQAPKIVLETLKVMNTVVKPDDGTKILTKNLALTSGIILNHHYPSFSIEFKAFDYIASNGIKYAYMLKGLSNEWNYVENRTYASFQNLSPGEYQFIVKAQNNNGTWSEEPAILNIKIKPAPWLTFWAFSGYFLMIALLVWGTFRLVLRAKLYKKELEIEHNERLREKEISHMKMRFFTNISHEIRTPVTLIKGNVDYLIAELNSKNIILKSTESLISSTNRLLRLINQLLSFRQLENDALDLTIRHENIIDITNEVAESFRYTANLIDVSIEIQTKENELIVPVDRDKYEKILSNLLSNSLKFSKKGGLIKIVVEQYASTELTNEFKVNPEVKNYLKIAVIDNGKGISAGNLPHIFDRYVKYANQESKPDYSSSGIGLNFIKRLIELHGGSITVKSEEKVETCFCFILPTDEPFYKLEDTVVNGETVLIEHNTPIPEQESTENNGTKNVILLAEDDIELNKFIQNALSDTYTVISTYNGREALKIAKNQLPDIIISDIMMPEMDGINLCKSVREDELISHIPIVLLTAKTEVENKILGFKYGADEYITKPFELTMLKARIQNLIKQRDVLKQYYKTAMPVELKGETINQFEINFMKRINKIIEENYGASEFNVYQLADLMHMSRTSFYRKFMSITDISPKDYITNYRVNKAIELIEAGEESFGEISYLCGFSSQSIFSIAFKKVKGVSPLQFKRLSQND